MVVMQCISVQQIVRSDIQAGRKILQQLNRAAAASRFNKDGSYERTRIVQRYWGKTYHNYDAERWDALTDGMEGDYPGSGVDYDLLGF